MKIGERLTLDGTFTDDNMIFFKQLGVSGIMIGIGTTAGYPERMPIVSKLRKGNYWETADLLELKERVTGAGLELFGLSHAPYTRFDKIIRGFPGRDEQIENWCQSLRNMGKADIPIWQYNWVINAGASLSNWRTSEDTIGRGGARLVSFDYEVAKKVPVANIGPITDEEMWDNLTYFLKAVIPVAEEAGVKMVVHPADPQVPAIAGIARIIRSISAYDRLFEIVPSESNGMVFCLGCFAQMLDTNGVCDAIRHFGSRNRIGYVHFRNINGSREKFDEVYPDEGKLDMLKAVRLLKEVGFQGYINPDHTPHGIGDTEQGHRGRAFEIGYMKGLMQAVFEQA